jgi:hypothetical protein
MYCSEEKPKKHEKTSKGYNQQIERIKKKHNIDEGMVSSHGTRVAVV